MKIEMRIGSRVIIIEAEGVISVQVLEDFSPATTSAMVAIPEEASAKVMAQEAEEAVELKAFAFMNGHVSKAVAQEAEEAVSEIVALEVEEVVLEAVAQEAPKTVSEMKAPTREDLFRRLVGLRRELAFSANVPPYVIFKDATLREMTEKLPQDLAAFYAISGVGKVKLEKYGEAFLAAIREGVAA